MAKDCQKEKEIRRQLNHLPDMQEGEKFTMVPRCLSDAWLNGDPRMPDMKFKILFCLMSHGSGFKIKRTYLKKRFHQKTFSKYMKELEKEGYIRVEKVPMPRGGHENVHHVNSIANWEISRNPSPPEKLEPAQEAASTDCSSVNMRQVDEGSPMIPPSVIPPSVTPLNETKGNETKQNEEEEIPPQIPAQSPRKKIPSATASSGGRITKTRLVGMMSGLYGKFAQAKVMSALVDELLDDAPKEVVFNVIKGYADGSIGKKNLEWDRESWGLWKAAVAEQTAAALH